MRTLTIAGAAVIGLATSPVHASEQTTTFNRVKTAYAESQNIQGCVETDIFVSPFDTNNNGSKGSQVNLNILKRNNCTGATLDQINGGIVLRLAAFSISADAASAKLTATVPVQNSHGKIYNARVQVTWTASGPPTSFVDRYKQFGPDGVFIQITKGKGRPADAAGKISIPGSTYVVKTEDAGISKESTITITRTSSPPQS